MLFKNSNKLKPKIRELIWEFDPPRDPRTISTTQDTVTYANTIGADVFAIEFWEELVTKTSTECCTSQSRFEGEVPKPSASPTSTGSSGGVITSTASSQALSTRDGNPIKRVIDSIKKSSGGRGLGGDFNHMLYEIQAHNLTGTNGFAPSAKREGGNADRPTTGRMMGTAVVAGWRIELDSLYFVVIGRGEFRDHLWVTSLSSISSDENMQKATAILFQDANANSIREASSSYEHPFHDRLLVVSLVLIMEDVCQLRPRGTRPLR
ncbi:hypothetical protein VTL71DRAFT_11161 [Oculimacula yallundae]|uniref:Uncharacterized protein n=1 Tax=Oculimacula yallundae TaxID=86028 RepID=A0ABR4CV47_9HELO